MIEVRDVKKLGPKEWRWDMDDVPRTVARKFSIAFVRGGLTF